MLKNKLVTLLLAAALLAGSLSLASCRRQDTTSPTEPEKTVQQLIPMLGEGQSPLPTPATNQSPLQP